jgi:DNA invertase Pin-like site-specific DNA recombinase
MKAALYCRLSEEDRDKRRAGDDSASIQNQKAMLRQYAAQQGWEIFQVYSDDDYAGADRNRPAFRQLLADAEQRKFDVVLCKTQSRFTRELELVETYLHDRFPRWGIRFVSIVDNADTDNKGNKKARQINGLVNEWYLEDLSENIRSVLTSRRQNGYHIGSFAPYGYEKDPEQRGRLRIDTEAAAVVREIFALYAGGCGKTAIARQLNTRGISNPTAYKQQCGLRYRPPPQKTGSLWTYTTIANILRNEVYIGNLVQGRYGSVSYKTKENRPKPPDQWLRVTGTHEAIIDHDLWERVQAQLAQRARPFSSGELGLFARKARCAGCGAVLRSSKSRGRHYLQCATHHVAPDDCPGAFIAVEKLEQLILQELGRLADRYLDRELLEKALPPPSQPQKAPLLRAKADNAKRQEAVTAAMRALYLDKVRGTLPEADFARLLADFSVQLRQLEQTAAALQKQLEHTEASSLSVPTSLPDHLTREAVDLLVERIVVAKRLPGTRIVPVTIYWRF